MFEIMSSIKNISRYYKKSVLITCVSMIIMLFVSYYIFLLNDGINKINYIYKTTKIEASTNSKDGSSGIKQIPYKTMKDQIEPCKEIKKSYYQAIYKILLDKDNLEKVSQIYATTDINREEIFAKQNAKIEYLKGYDSSSFGGKDKICVVSKDTLKENKLKIGDSIYIYSPIKNPNKDSDAIKLKIIGAYNILENNTLTEFQLASNAKAVYCSFYPFSEDFIKFYKLEYGNTKYSIPFDVSEAKYTLKDASKVEDFRKFVIENGEFYTEQNKTGILEGISLYKVVIHDEELKQMLGGVKSVVFFLKIALPFVVAILVTIGFTISYLITQNRINDIALMRIMGIKRINVFNMILGEMLIPSIIGGFISILISQILYRRWFNELPGVQFNLLLFLSYIFIFIIGASVALSMILKLKPIQVLTKKE